MLEYVGAWELSYLVVIMQYSQQRVPNKEQALEMGYSMKIESR